MFAQDIPSLPAAANPSLRNPRRRPRNSSDENGHLIAPKAKKRRSVLAPDTFVKPAEAAAPPANGTVAMNGTASKGADRAVSFPSTRDLPMRETRKTSGQRGLKTDHMVLTRNERFVVSKLFALPDCLRGAEPDAFRVTFCASSSYALAVTTNRAIAWPYDGLVSAPETFIFALPSMRGADADVLPLGALVPPSVPSAEPGLLIVMPTTGKIMFWDSVTNAAALDLTRPQRSGLEATVGGMASGDSVVDLVDATPAGFVLAFSSGRLALLNLRDSLGRPLLRVQVMRGHLNTNGGLLDGLKSVFIGGTWRKDVVAVKSTNRRTREERDVAVVTAKGIVQIWAVHRAGQHFLRHEAHAGPDMIAAIKMAGDDLEELTEDTFEILDFTFVPVSEPMHEPKLGEGEPCNSLLVLGAFRRADSATYVLFEAVMHSASLTVGLVYPIRSYSTPFPQGSRWRPKLLLPQPPHTAFVVFEEAVVIASMGKGSNSPEQQLLHDIHRFPKAYEDVVDFREGLDVHVLGCAAENGLDVASLSALEAIYRKRSHNPACVLYLKRVGVVRVVASPISAEEIPVGRSGLSVKSKIEQAICYGAHPMNPLNFSARPETQYSQEEVEEAALAISTEILRSDSEAVPYLTPSLEVQLKQRATALKELASYVKASFPPLSRITKWKLLWDAEKLAGARAVWARYDLKLGRKDPNRKIILLVEILDMLSSRFKDAPDPQKGELDIVRHWFIKDIGRLQFIIPWAWNAIREIEKDGDLTPATMAELVMDAHDLVISALDTAYTFRKDNLALYGLEEEPLRDGVLPPQACEGLPEPWTSTLMIPENMKELVGRSRKTCETWFLKPSHAESAPNPDTVTQIAGEQAVIVHLCCQAYAERYRWCLGQRDSSIRTAGYTLQREYHSTRKELITKLAGIKFVDRAIDLAERYEDMPILVELFSKEFNQAAMSVMGIALPVEQRAAKERRLAMLQDRYVGYFHKFGTRWAHALFALHVRHGNLAGLLTDHGEWQEYLTDFLRANPALAKLSWINEVLGEQDYGAASKALLDLAAVKERDLWSKKVELSIGKLSLLAAQVGEEQQRQNDDEKQPDDSRLAQVDKNFELITIQERLYRHVAPSIRQAIDEAAEIDLVKKDFGSVAMKSMPALGQVLEQALNTLVARQPMNAEMLIDALTLIDHRSDLDSQSEVTGREFFLALRVVQIVYDEDPDKAQLLERIIWRRCMIRDDWTAINNTQLKRDRAVEQSTDNTALYTNLVAGFLAGIFRDTSPLRPRAPSAVLGAGSSAAELRSMFPDDLCETIAVDMRKEDARLRAQMERGRLEHWFAGVVEAARASAQAGARAEVLSAQAKRQVDAEMQQAALLVSEIFDY